jgi:hypothetical protein
MRVIDTQTSHSISAVLIQLLAYCKSRNWAGADPYDALNSEWLTSLPWLNRRVPRLILTQVLKRSPLNLRPLLRIPPTQNPKALALFVAAFVKMHRMGLLEDRQLIDEMISTLEAQRSPGNRHYCWGYSFPWQTRSVIVPRGDPNLVCTVFVAHALLDVHETFHDSKCLEMALDAARSIHQLYWEQPDGHAGFGYPLPTSRTGVHNANFLGAALLCRIDRLCQEPELADAGLKAARYSASQQRPDGSWPYSELPTQPWIDNFHTGYNLCALKSIGTSRETAEFEPSLQRGFRFYRRHFFREDGAPKYFHNRNWPIDIHSVAQSLITLSELKQMDCGSSQQAQSVLNWALRNLWDKQAFFYYRAYPLWKNRTYYMRSAQAWMMLALATTLENSSE